MVATLPIPPPDHCALCGQARHRHLIDYQRPPPGETDFAILDYRRTMWQCLGCGHIVNRYGFDLARSLYRGAYAQATYGERMRQTFRRIMALAPEHSDNRQRVMRINAYASRIGLPSRALLDVGSGLGVFPAAMTEAGWSCTAIDPDPQATALIAELAGAGALCGDFMAMAPSGRYALIAFNKVLEHVDDMVAMLIRARDWLEPKGCIYVEVPDGEAAIFDSPDREEFFVEHLCAFSAASLALLAHRADLSAEIIERVREPSRKYTLRAFLRQSRP